MPVLLQSLFTDDMEDRYLKALIVGNSKAGKTNLAATAPDPFLIAIDPGQDSLYRLNIPYYPAKSLDEIRQILMIMRMDPADRSEALGIGKRPIRTVILDVLDEAQKLWIRERLKETGRDFLAKDDYSWLNEKMRNMVKGFRDLDLNVIFTCHAQEREDDAGRVVVQPMIVGGFRDELPGHVSIAAVLSVQQISEITPEGVTTRLARVLQTEPDLKHPWVGDRLRILPGKYEIQERKDAYSVTTDFTDLIAASFGDQKQKVATPPKPAATAPEADPKSSASSLQPTAEAPVLQNGKPKAEKKAAVLNTPAGPIIEAEKATQTEATAVAVLDGPFTFDCEKCGTTVTDPQKDDYDLSQMRKGKALCRTCYSTEPNI